MKKFKPYKYRIKEVYHEGIRSYYVQQYVAFAWSNIFLMIIYLLGNSRNTVSLWGWTTITTFHYLRVTNAYFTFRYDEECSFKTLNEAEEFIQKDIEWERKEHEKLYQALESAKAINKKKRRKKPAIKYYNYPVSDIDKIIDLRILNKILRCAWLMMPFIKLGIWLYRINNYIKEKRYISWFYEISVSSEEHSPSGEIIYTATYKPRTLRLIPFAIIELPLLVVLCGLIGFYHGIKAPFFKTTRKWLKKNMDPAISFEAEACKRF